MRFLPAVPVRASGPRPWSTGWWTGAGPAPHLWRIRLTREAPALLGRLTDGGLRVGDLLRSPQGREHSLEAVALALLRDGTSVIAPDDDVLSLDDQLLLAGRPAPAGRWTRRSPTSRPPPTSSTECSRRRAGSGGGSPGGAPRRRRNTSEARRLVELPGASTARHVAPRQHRDDHDVDTPRDHRDLLPAARGDHGLRPRRWRRGSSPTDLK